MKNGTDCAIRSYIYRYFLNARYRSNFAAELQRVAAEMPVEGKTCRKELRFDQYTLE